MGKIQINTNEAPQAVGPYSQAIVSENFLFISGQIAIDAKTQQVVSGSVKEQTQQVLKNVEKILNAAGCSFESVVKTTVYLKNMDDMNIFNEVYQKCFYDNPPARSCIEVSRLPKNVLVEIEAVALIKNKSSRCEINL